jgi:hypothetical protein
MDTRAFQEANLVISLHYDGIAERHFARVHKNRWGGQYDDCTLAFAAALVLDPAEEQFSTLTKRPVTMRVRPAGTDKTYSVSALITDLLGLSQEDQKVIDAAGRLGGLKAIREVLHVEVRR